MNTDLITIETLKAADVFKPGAVEKLISDLEAKVRAIPPADHTTEKGRNEIKALAYKVTRSKTALDDLGKNHVAELKKAAGVVDADRRIIWDRLDALKNEVRKPVDEFEAADERRIDAHKANMETLQGLDAFAIGRETIDEIDSRLLTLYHFQNLDWQEFTDGASRIIGRLATSLPTLRAKLVKQEEEKAELERLRKAESERQEKQRILDTERERQEHEDRLKAKFKQEADARIAKAEREAKDAVALAAADKATALQRAEHERKAAIEAERKRVADAKAAEEAATRKREANKKHLATINYAALASLVMIKGLEVDIAKAVIIAIASGKIAHIRIEY